MNRDRLIEIAVIGLLAIAALIPVGTSSKPGPTPSANDLGGAIRRAHANYSGAWRSLGVTLRDGISKGELTPEQAAKVFGERLGQARDKLRADEVDAVKTHLQGKDKTDIVSAWNSVAR